MSLDKILNRSERTLLRAAINSWQARVKSKLGRILRRNTAQASPGPQAPFIPVLRTSISDREIFAAINAVTGDWYHGTDVALFEKKFREYVGSKFAVATSNCTGALHLALRGLGVGPGDEVLVPETSCNAPANAVAHCGARPVFVDVDPQTWCMDPASARRAVTNRAKVILPVHQYGNPADLRGILDLARQHDLKVLEDSAGALGAAIDGQKTGTFGNAGAFSFHSTKLMTTGEGGMFVTSDSDLYQRVALLAHHGRDLKDTTHAVEIGFNYRMSHLQAAIGLAQLTRIDELLNQRRLIYSCYQARLADVKGLALQSELVGARSNRWMIAAVVDEGLGISGAQIVEGLKNRRIDSQSVTRPLSSCSVFESREAQNPVAYRLWRTGVLLPSGFGLTKRDVDRICNELRTLCIRR